MGNFLIIILVLIAVFLVIRWTQENKPKTTRERRLERVSKPKPSELSLFHSVRKGFSEFKVLKKHETVFICDVDNIRREPEEIVFIRIEPNKLKSLEVKGRFMVATYPYIPTAKQMRKDFAPVLFRYK
ncbi:MAG TPA: hypothetical protein PLS76_04355 [Acinetobacter sp.]|nr:hypothetical protein [Acinetobacter sp.]HQW52868.1 hypothetical protein [Acinetobacter sp.]HQZ58499.1 hypothetical protein [Acinetobacter sp.]